MKNPKFIEISPRGFANECYLTIWSQELIEDLEGDCNSKYWPRTTTECNKGDLRELLNDYANRCGADQKSYYTTQDIIDMLNYLQIG